jgi:hypothetical protein
MLTVMRIGVVTVVMVLAAGCCGPKTVTRPNAPSPTAGPVETALSTAAASPITPAIEPFKLPDAARIANPPPVQYRGADESQVQCLAAAAASIANALDEENAKPSTVLVSRRSCPDFRGDDLLRELRRQTALALRNRAAADALDRYLQLADAIARTQLARDGLMLFDELRIEAPKLRAAGVPAPDDDDLLRQRARLLADIAAGDAGIALLNHDLAMKMNVRLAAGERLWPTTPFNLDDAAIDVDAAVRTGLASRAELNGLRTLQQGLNADTLPSIREQLKSMNGLLGSGPPAAKVAGLFHKCKDTSADDAELASRQKQIADLLESKEVETEGHVRQALVQMTAIATKAALLQLRVTSFEEKWEKAKSEGRKLDTITSQLDLLRAKAEVISAVMEWHQWRIRLKAAQGLLAEECLRR